MTLNVLEITKRWLEKRGYQGLCNPDAECVCDIDDLFASSSYQGGDCKGACRFDCYRCAREECLQRGDYDVLFAIQKDFCQPIYEGGEVE